MEQNYDMTKVYELLSNGRLTEAEQEMLAMAARAREEKNAQQELVILNELIGFYRDCGRFSESLSAGQDAMLLARDMDLVGTIPYGTTLINVANALRAAGHADAAQTYFTQARETLALHLPENDILFASLQNNLSLLLQEKGDFAGAASEGEKALAIVRENLKEAREAQDAERVKDLSTKEAISLTNIALSKQHMDQDAEAEKLLTQALSFFTGLTPSDFHYSAALSGMGDLCLRRKEYERAAEYYETALSEIRFHMGVNNFHEIVSEHLEEAYRGMGTTAQEYRESLSGMEICRRYYRAFWMPLYKRNFKTKLPQIACGLMGEGSECFGYDDKISRDHDFGPGFCIWIDDSVSEKQEKELRTAYALLPPTYMGYTRFASANETEGRVGVMRTSDFFRRMFGLPKVPATQEEWLAVPEEGLAQATNGDVFYDGSGAFSRQLKQLKDGYPETVLLRRIAQQLGLMEQSGPYNCMRAFQRGDAVTARLYLDRFATASMRFLHLMANRYAPYMKWLYRSTTEIDADFASATADLFEHTDDAEATKALIDAVIVKANALLKRGGYIDEETAAKLNEGSAGLMDVARMLSSKADAMAPKEAAVMAIIELEWEAFDLTQNEGGRAGCQDDWETFSIMRRSQYETWPADLLESYLSDLMAAKAEGRNLITEKYGRMMESTAPAEYAKIRDALPALDADQIRIREAIVAIYVGWMEEVAAAYPKFAGQARVIHTSEDTMWRTSYETYLRGEISTYSPQTLTLFGRMTAQAAQNGENLSKAILLRTAQLYGYGSIEEAEAAIED